MTTATALPVLERARAIQLAELSDAELTRLVADRIRIPRRDPADSFVLHSPLELLARAALLPAVAPAGRRPARLRIVSLLVQYEAGDPMTVPVPVAEPADPPAALAAAIAAGDLDGTDLAGAAVAGALPPEELAGALGAFVLPALAAAGHAPIFLYHLPRVAPRGEATAELLRPLARELARAPGWHIGWVADRPATGGSPEALAEALTSVPSLGLPGSAFIFPLMHQVDGAVAPELLRIAAAGVGPRAAARVILRHAARAMLAADPAHTPYGWTHCLTMPQAALGIAGRLADPQLAVDVAATYVVGFLAGLADAPVPGSIERAPVGGSFDDALAAGREAVAGWVLHAPESAVAETWTALVTRACGRHDAHLVKYTLACVDAAAADPGASRLFLAAGAALLADWEATVDGDDPLDGPDVTGSG